jgi:hypothetical protein
MRSLRRTALTILVVLASVALVGLTNGASASAVPSPTGVLRPTAAPSAGSLTPVGDAAQLPSGAVVEGSVAPTRYLTVDIVLRLRRAGRLHDLAARASTGGRLARGSFAGQFGAPGTAVAALRARARAAGLSVAPSAADGLLLAVSGPAARLEHFFHTRLSQVRLADGTTGRRTEGPVRLPASLAASVAGVVGLDDLTERQPVALATGPAAADPTRSGSSTRTASSGGPGPQACPAAQADATTSGVFTDDALASLYGVDGLYSSGSDGAGQTIAVYELEPFAASDVTAFDTCYFGTTGAAAMASRLHVISVDGGQPTGPGVGEAALDIEDVSALAPGATIDVYEAPNTTAGSLDEFSRIIGDDTASVITTSAGLCEAAMQADEPGVQAIENTLFEQAAAQGQTVVAAAGDDGSSDCGTEGHRPVPPALSVDDPASQPFVLAVGGTSVSSGTTPVQSAWNDGPAGGGGGGLSKTWTAPGWQLDSGVPGVADAAVIAAAEAHDGARFCAGEAAACREVPDVSAAADPEAGAITIFYDGTWTAKGGTSSAAPLWAAMLADAASTPACRTDVGADGRIGFAPPLLYAVAADPATYATSFEDITTGTNSIVPATSGLYPTTPGYDMATGLGTPRWTGPGGTPGLAAALCSAVKAPVPTVTGLDPATVSLTAPTGRSAPVVTVHGTGFMGDSGPVVASVTVGGARLPVGTGTKYPVTVVDNLTLTFRAPPAADLAPHADGGDGAGDYQVTVTLVGGSTSRPGPRSLLAYVATSGSGSVPVVASVGPTGGSPAGGAVTLHGAGFTGATRVTFGSVPAPAFRVVADDEISATVPPESGATHCATATDPTTDVCQIEVVVVTPGGSSAPAPILPPYQGAYSPDLYGGFPAPSGCGCETAPAASEYDYLALPTITSVSAGTGSDGQIYLNALGHSTVTVHGTGFDILGYQWANLGPWNDASSADLTLTSISPTVLTLSAPVAPPGAMLPLSLPLTVQTLASPDSQDLSSGPSPSNAVTLVYAPVPTESALAGGGRHSAGPTTGGTALTVTGTGFEAANSVLIVDQTPTGPSLAQTKDFTVHGSTLHFVTPPAADGVDDVLVCTATMCAIADPAVDTFTYYTPGDPTLTSVDPSQGPATGGKKVVLTGTGLGFVVGVRFGSVPATVFANAKGTDDGGDPTTIDVTAPPGKAGATVPIRVETLASAIDGTGYSAPTAAAQFTYGAGRGSGRRADHRSGRRAGR